MDQIKNGNYTFDVKLCIKKLKLYTLVYQFVTFLKLKVQENQWVPVTGDGQQGRKKRDTVSNHPTIELKCKSVTIDTRQTAEVEIPGMFSESGPARKRSLS